MDIHYEHQPFWATKRFDIWLSLLIGLLTAMSLSHIPSGIAAALLVKLALNYAEEWAHLQNIKSGEVMVRLPVQTL